MSVSKNGFVIEVVRNLNKDIDFKRNLKKIDDEVGGIQFKSVKKFVGDNASFYGIPLTVKDLEQQVRDSLDILSR